MQDFSSIDARINRWLSDFGACPSLSNMRVLAWEYRNLLCRFSLNFDAQGVAECMECIVTLGYSDRDFKINVSRSIMGILFRQRDNVPSWLLDIFFDYIFFVRDVVDIQFYKDLLKAFTLHSRVWNAYPDFCEWWGFANLSDSDFIKSGDSFPLGSSAYLAYARAILKSTLSPLCLSFWSDFARRMAGSDFSIYAHLQFASFLIRVGHNRAEVLRILRPLVVRKYMKPWVWLAVSEVFPFTDIRHKAALIFALSCIDNVQDTRSLQVYLQLSRFYKAQGDFNNCRYFVNRLWSLSTVHHDILMSDFSSFLGTETYSPNMDPTFDYRGICHDIFAGVVDSDGELWLKLSADIKLMEI